MILARALVLLVLLGSVVRADGTPSYFGTWVDEEGDCDVSHGLTPGTYRFGPRYRMHFEGQCRVSSSTLIDGRWEEYETCGPKMRMHWSMKVEGDKMTAIVTRNNEKPDQPSVMKRCP